MDENTILLNNFNNDEIQIRRSDAQICSRRGQKGHTQKNLVSVFTALLQTFSRGLESIAGVTFLASSCSTSWYVSQLYQTIQLQEVPAFRDFTIRKPRYFVILFQASISWIPRNFVILEVKNKSEIFSENISDFFAFFVAFDIFIFAYRSTYFLFFMNLMNSVCIKKHK